MQNRDARPVCSGDGFGLAAPTPPALRPETAVGCTRTRPRVGRWQPGNRPPPQRTARRGHGVTPRRWPAAALRPRSARRCPHRPTCPAPAFATAGRGRKRQGCGDNALSATEAKPNGKAQQRRPRRERCNPRNRDRGRRLLQRIGSAALRSTRQLGRARFLPPTDLPLDCHQGGEFRDRASDAGVR
jgi:hypothetical protein